MITVYLAGPEVFLPDGRAILEAKRTVLRDYGLEPVSPPAEFRDQAKGSCMERGLEISRRNEQLVRLGDACIANLTPFRGPSADAGTVYELGFAAALGKLVTSYSNDATLYSHRVQDAINAGADLREDSGDLWALDGMRVENHGMADNLMLAGGVLTRGGQVHVPGHVATDLWRDLDTFTQAVRDLAQI